VFLWLTFLGMVWLAYTAWVNDYPSAAPPPGSTTAPGAEAQIDDTFPELNAAPAAPAVAEAPSGELVRVRTDVLDVLIDSRGADLVRADLLQYPVDKRAPDRLVRLLDNAPGTRWVFQTGVRSALGGAEPNHQATFRTPSNEYTLAPGQNELVVTFDWVGEGP